MPCTRLASYLPRSSIFSFNVIKNVLNPKSVSYCKKKTLCSIYVYISYCYLVKLGYYLLFFFIGVI